MVEVVKFKAEHILSIRKQDHDAIELPSYNYEQYLKIENLKHSYSIVVDGIVMACVGIVEYWSNRGEAWAVIDRYAGPKMLSIVREMKLLFSIVDCDRIEAAVIHNFKQGHRLVKLLGFELEASIMRKYGVTGFDYSLYARVK